ncbi:hypothetical protein B296_00022438 [Ensete ventricosum]|uniref:Uncharacterized protein n=1 Tax=Ensete ventricosum TaxID=4639 RepID=A0A426Y4F3_ENSVE|nr:hypothetical protein B296_00022438 [Ensete ventricosum]
MDAATTRHGSRTPRWLVIAGGFLEKEPLKRKSRRLKGSDDAASSRRQEQRSKCDSGSDNRQSLGYGRGGRRRGAAVATNLVEEGPHVSLWVQCHRERGRGRHVIVEGLPAAGEQVSEGESSD